MDYTITICTDNVAFEDMPRGFEVARILEQLARKFRNDGHCEFCAIMDSNGNKCGEVKAS